jgi:hypothetical protein
MIFRLAIAAGMLALAACQPAAAPSDQPAATQAQAPAMPAPAPEPTAANGCEARTQKQWGPAYRVEAWTSGASCAGSVVTLAVYTADSSPIYAWAGATQYLFALRDATTQPEMQQALNEWSGPDNLPPEMTGTLPPWDETDGQAKAAEFPFMPNMDKAAYEELRKSNLPMLCYPQGIESQLCLAMHDGPMIEEIGLQRFPG